MVRGQASFQQHRSAPVTWCYTRIGQPGAKRARKLTNLALRALLGCCAVGTVLCLLLTFGVQRR